MHKLHIATGDFCFLETDFDGTAEEAIQEAKRLQEAVLGQPGLSEQEWNRWIGEYLSTGTVVDGADRWASMSDKQKWCVNEIKKARKRKGVEPEIN